MRPPHSRTLMRNPFLLGLFDSLTHTDHHTAPLDVRTVLREHGGLQAFQSAADPDRWLAAVEHDLDERIRGRDRWIRDYTIGMKTANILKVLLPPLILGCIAQPSRTLTERSHHGHGWQRTCARAGMNNDTDLNNPPVLYENGELLLSDQWQPAATNTLNPDDTTHTYINHGEIIEFSHHIFENDDVGEEIYGVGYTDGVDSIAMRDWRGVGRDASRAWVPISPIRTFAVPSDRRAKQPNGTRPNMMGSRWHWIMSNSDPTARMIRISSPTTSP